MNVATSKITELLIRCGIATSYDIMVQEMIEGAIVEKGSRRTPPLISGENQLLAFATYFKCTDIILYALPFVLNIDGRNVLYLRFVVLYVLIIYKHFTNIVMLNMSSSLRVGALFNLFTKESLALCFSL